MNLKVVGHTLGKMSLLLSLTLIFPLFISIIDHSPDSKGFFFTILLGIVLGLILSLIKHDSKIGRKEGFAIVDRKSTRLNSSHVRISYAVFCLKKKNI